MSEQHMDLAAQLADVLNILGAVLSGHTSRIDLETLQTLLNALAADWPVSADSGVYGIDFAGASRALAVIITGLSIESWDKLDQTTLDAIRAFLASVRVDLI
jgi:hypothetical protein